MFYLLSILLFNLVSDYQWQSLPSCGIRNHDHAVAYDPINDLFFITGGDSTGQQINMDICLSFDPKTNTWDTLEPMPTKNARHRASYRNGFIHVVCGYDDGVKFNRHEVYDISDDSWDTAASAPLRVTSPCLVTWRDSLVYLIGGYDEYSNARTDVYFYDAVADTWNSATFLPRKLHCGRARVKGDSIFIIGGSDGGSYYTNILLGEIDPADPAEIDWSWGQPLPMAYNADEGLAIKDNNIYMIGGNFGDGNNEVWEYDIQNETWTSLPDYPTSIIIRSDFAERRDGPDSSGVVYCFMGDTSDNSSMHPTDECYRLRSISYSGIEEEKLEKSSVSLNSIINLAGEIAINCNILERCDLKIYMYDVLGRQVFSSLEKDISVGSHQLNLKTNLTNGIYFIKIEAGKAVASEKILLIR